MGNTKKVSVKKKGRKLRTAVGLASVVGAAYIATKVIQAKRRAAREKNAESEEE